MNSHAISRRGWSWASFAQVTLLVALVLPAGCGTSGYLAMRRQDAADIVTVSVGAGIGMKARVGPLGTGVLMDSPLAGLRGGDWLTQANYANPGRPIPVNNDIQMLLVGEEEFLGSRKVQERGKAFAAGMICGLNIPAPAALESQAKAVDRAVHQVAPQTVPYSPWPYLTQIEAVVGLGVSLRLGVNPGEFLDFVLGWAGVDLFSDDIEQDQ